MNLREPVNWPLFKSYKSLGRDPPFISALLTIPV